MDCSELVVGGGTYFFVDIIMFGRVRFPVFLGDSGLSRDLSVAQSVAYLVN